MKEVTIYTRTPDGKLTEKVVNLTGIKNLRTLDFSKKNINLFKNNYKIKDGSNGRILQVKSNFDFRFGQDLMLETLRKDMKINLEDMRPGNYVVFLNTENTRLRMLTVDDFGDPVFVVKNMPKGRFIDPRIIKHIPKAFNGKAIDWATAEQEMILEADLCRTRRRNSNTLLTELTAN